MKRITTLALLAFATVTCEPAYAQSQPFEFSYQWTLSGKEYATVATPLRDLGRGLTFDAVAGYEVRSGATPTLGFGASCSLYEVDGFYAKAGAFILFPQKQQPDIGFGLSAGFRF